MKTKEIKLDGVIERTAERVKLYDGRRLHEAYKDWLHKLKEATAVLSAAMDDISEFAPKLTLSELIKMNRGFQVYMQAIERKALDWVNQQRPLMQELSVQQADRLMTLVHHAFAAWQKSYQNIPQVDGRYFPKRLIDLNNLSGLFDGFTLEWFESIRDEFDEYADTPGQIALLQAMQTLADAANDMARFARHWQHKTNPLMAFCRYDSQSEKFVPSIEGVRAYVTVYTDAPLPPAQIDEVAIARERLRNILFGKTGFATNSDAELLAAEFFGNDETSKAAREYQQTLKQLVS